MTELMSMRSSEEAVFVGTSEMAVRCRQREKGGASGLWRTGAT